MVCIRFCLGKEENPLLKKVWKNFDSFVSETYSSSKFCHSTQITKASIFGSHQRQFGEMEHHRSPQLFEHPVLSKMSVRHWRMPTNLCSLVLFKTIWYRPHILMDVLSRTKFQGPFSVDQLFCGCFIQGQMS